MGEFDLFNKTTSWSVIWISLSVFLFFIFVFLKNILNKNQPIEENKNEPLPIIDVTLEDVRKAVRSYSDQLPKGVFRTILVQDDYSIDFEQLASHLGGIPSERFYMSKETYEIFEEREKDIPAILDHVQQAVDCYMSNHSEYPILPYDPFSRVNYFQLLQAHCLDKQPDIDLYITKYDGLVTHIKPKKRSTGH